MSVNTNNSPSLDYTTNPDDHSNHNIDSPGFKPFTVINIIIITIIIIIIIIIVVIITIHDSKSTASCKF